MLHRLYIKNIKSSDMVDRKVTGPITIERQWFIDSRQGNIKDDYYFEKKLGSGGYGAVYLAKHKKTGKERERAGTQYLNSVIISLVVSLLRNTYWELSR
jgi:hypothetical protein